MGKEIKLVFCWWISVMPRIDRVFVVGWALIFFLSPRQRDYDGQYYLMIE